MLVQKTATSWPYDSAVQAATSITRDRRTPYEVRQDDRDDLARRSSASQGYTPTTLGWRYG